MAADAAGFKKVLHETRRRGYAVNRGERLSEASVTAIAFPIRIGDHAIAAVNLVLQMGAVTDREIATRNVPLLRTLAEEISVGVGQFQRG